MRRTLFSICSNFSRCKTCQVSAGWVAYGPARPLMYGEPMYFVAALQRPISNSYHQMLGVHNFPQARRNHLRYGCWRWTYPARFEDGKTYECHSADKRNGTRSSCWTGSNSTRLHPISAWTVQVAHCDAASLSYCTLNMCSYQVSTNPLRLRI